MVVRLGAAALVAACALQAAPDWRRIGSSSVELMLAAPATGPIDRVWFSPDGAVLFAKTRAGRVFQTLDYQNWTPSNVEAPATVPSAATRLPEPGARVVSQGGPVLYSLGRHLFRSEDSGKTWINLTAYRSESVVGWGQRSVAVSPANASELILANDWGVWRSMDGGLSWTGLNQLLPNLGVRKIVSTPAGAVGPRVLADGMGVLELPPGGSVWQLAVGVAVPNEATIAQQYSAAARAEITAFGSSENRVYAGAEDGRIFVSVDGGRTFPAAYITGGGRVERIVVDPTQPLVAVAALSGRGPHVVHTMNGGVFWDRLDGNLPNADAHSVAADRAGGAVYAATDRGLFYAMVDLDAPISSPISWTSLSDNLPPAAAVDVRLDPAGVQLYTALEGYGVFATLAPHRLRNFRIVSAADYGIRPAAPGSLLSVMGGRVQAVRGGNLTYPVLAASDTESQIQVPFEATGPNVELALDTATGQIRRGLPVQPVSPAILVGRDGAPMLWDADTGLLLDAGNTAHMNGRIQIWATGLGRVRPDWPTGMAAPLQNPPSVVANVRAYLDRTPLQVTRATLVPGYVGFYLIEVQLPSLANSGTAELYISADGQESNRVQMVVDR